MQPSKIYMYSLKLVTWWETEYLSWSNLKRKTYWNSVTLCNSNFFIKFFFLLRLACTLYFSDTRNSNILNGNRLFTLFTKYKTWVYKNF